MKIWISVSTFNRKKITEIVVDQLSRYKDDSFFHISDDYSTDYSLDNLLHWSNADKIERPPHKMGIHHLRCWELEQFMKTDYDLCYLTDNDAYHDPSYVYQLKNLYSRYKLPVSLYNTKWHFNSTVSRENGVIIRKTIPGISQLYDRDMVQRILNNLQIYGKPIYAWDYRFIEYLNTNTVTSDISYIDHMGVGGIHNKSLTDFDRDRAHNPSPFLVQRRTQIIDTLNNNIPLHGTISIS